MRSACDGCPSLFVMNSAISCSSFEQVREKTWPAIKKESKLRTRFEQGWRAGCCQVETLGWLFWFRFFYMRRYSAPENSLSSFLWGFQSAPSSGLLVRSFPSRGCINNLAKAPYYRENDSLQQKSYCFRIRICKEIPNPSFNKPADTIPPLTWGVLSQNVEVDYKWSILSLVVQTAGWLHTDFDYPEMNPKRCNVANWTSIAILVGKHGFIRLTQPLYMTFLHL